MKKAFIITVTILTAIVVILSILLVSSNSALSASNISLENLYQRSFYELVNNVNNMEAEVSKLMVTNDSTSQQKSLAKIKQQTSEAESSLSLLPINSNTLEKTTRFMNQLNGYCTSLITYKDGTLSESDYDTLSKAYQSVDTIKKELNSIMDKIMQGYKITDNLDNGGDNADFTLSFGQLSNDTVEYPSLIYDGPFSDSTINKKIKGLSNKHVTENDAENLITKIFENKITNLNYLGDTKGAFETFDFGVNTEDGKNYFVQITKQGGFLLTMSANVNNVNLENNESNEIIKDNDNSSSNNASSDTDTVNIAEKGALENSEKVKVESVNNVNEQTKSAIGVAESFATKLGIEDMKCVWSAASQEVSYINLAPVIDDITMYPDLIKVKIDLSDYSVVGWEASSYAYNHTTRDDLIPQLSESEAKGLVSKNLKVNAERLCVIPLEYSGEALAYEFSGTYNDSIFYVYIDAENGSQIRVLKVVQTDEGELIL